MQKQQRSRLIEIMLSACLAVSVAFGVPGQWDWVGGSSQSSQAGVYTGATLWPGARCCAHSWVAAQGNNSNTTTLWVWGGYGHDEHGTLGFLNDLWSFDVSTRKWKWL
jgi:hypothetical protein